MTTRRDFIQSIPTIGAAFAVTGHTLLESPAVAAPMAGAATDAHRMIAERMPRVVPIVSNWQIVRLDKRMSGEPMVAASGAMLGLLWNPAEISTYDIAFIEGAGAPLDGNNRYVLRFAPPPAIERR